MLNLKGQFSVVNKAIFIPDGRSVAIKHVQLLEMVDSKARNDCIKEIQLLKVLFNLTQPVNVHKPVFYLFFFPLSM